MSDAAKQCMCKSAVMRAYRELRERDILDVDAFESAARIFRYHHPEATPRQSRFTVAEWLDPVN